MKRMFRSLVVLMVCGLGFASVTGCGSSGAPVPAAAPVPAVSVFDIGKAYEADEAKARAEYASRTIKLTDLMVSYYVEDEKMLECQPFNAATKEGSCGSDSFFRNEAIKQIAFPLAVKFRIEDPKLVEGLTFQKVTTVDGKARADYTDLVEVEGDVETLADGDLILKNPKITKK
ncbi:MAG TPA: hypothetical protein VIV61_09840 [Candidatus Ozemobacteraceae bacterium]